MAKSSDQDLDYKKIRVTIHDRWHGFYNMASDWLVIVLPANQKPGLKMLLTNIDFHVEISLENRTGQPRGPICKHS